MRVRTGLILSLTIEVREFLENFDDGWFCANNFSGIFTEDFQTDWVFGGYQTLFQEMLDVGWFEDNTFGKIAEDVFDNGWFVNNSFDDLFTEDFQGVW
jgi:hypothetical protein